MSGKLITFEGIDGSGKSSAIQTAQDVLTEKGLEVILTRQPGGTKVGEAIRKVLLFGTDNEVKDSENISPGTEVLLFCASFRQSVDHFLLPNLLSGKWIISDRYTDSTRAYQGGGRGLTPDFLETLLKTTVEYREELIPLRTFLFDVDPETAAQRVGRRGDTKDRFESEEIHFQTNIRETYRRLAKENPDRFILVDTNILDQEACKAKVRAEMEKLLEQFH